MAQPGSDNDLRKVAARGPLKGLNVTMGIASKAMVLAFVLFTILNTDLASATFNTIKDWILVTLNWYYVGIVSFFLLFVFYLLFSRYGNVRLGDDDERPEFSYFSWFSMLFGAGMGIGLLFWSIAEPVYHFQSNPFISEADEGTARAAVTAMRITFLHWGLHAWAIYVIVALSLSYFAYRKKLPLTIRSSLHPLIGDRIYGPTGHAADLLAVFGTVFGVATSLGLGVQQINAGLGYLTGMPVNVYAQIILIAIITAIATLSAVTGVGNGIRIISEWNMWLSAVILAFFLFFGATGYVLGEFLTNLGDYAKEFIPLGFWTDPVEGRPWQGWWTVFYWGWWIAWSPFVGMFIARISRGRTIREFILGVLFVPTLLTFFWLAVFGGNALWIELYGPGGIVEAVNEDVTLALYTTIEQMGVGLLGTIAAALATLLIATYFITSSDSGTLVVTTMLSMGDEEPPTGHRIFWGVTEGTVAAVLLIAGGLSALQTASITAALPFSVIMLIMCYGLVKALAEEPVGPQYREPEPRPTSAAE